MKPQVPIEVDEATGAWSVDGLPMILVPRHFFVNNHAAVEAVVGTKVHSDLLFDAGHESAYFWCEKEARTHGLKGIEVFHHYMKRLSQRGWGRFIVDAVDARSGIARVRVLHSIFVAEMRVAKKLTPGRKSCYMFRGWFPGALEFVAAAEGRALKLLCSEVQCAAEGAHDHCVFETRALTE